jgi:hypothetical protein
MKFASKDKTMVESDRGMFLHMAITSQHKVGQIS